MHIQAETGKSISSLYAIISCIDDKNKGNSIMEYSNLLVPEILRHKTELLHEKLKNKVSIDLSCLISSESDIKALKLFHEFEETLIELEMNDEELVRENYKELFDFTSLGFFVISKDGTILDLNLSFAKMLGQECETIKNRNFTSFISEDTLPIFNCFIEKVFECRSRQTCEVILSGNDHLQTCVLLTGIHVENGQQCHVTAVDITEHKQFENLLVKDCQNYEDFFNGFDDFIFVLDEQGTIIHTNLSVNTCLGYSNEELKGKSFLMIQPPERVEQSSKMLIQILNSQIDFCYCPLITNSGVIIPTETRVSHGYWDGQPVIYAINKNITQIKQSEEKFSKVFYLNPSACGLTDLETGQYVEVNDAFYSLFGFNYKEVIGKTPAELGIFSPETLNSVLSRSSNSENVINIDAILKTKNGDLKHVLLSAENIVIHDKDYRFSVVHDITKRKEAEELLLFSNIILRTEQELSNEGILVVNEKGEIISFNHRFVELWEIPPEILGSKSDELAIQSVKNKLVDPKEFVDKVNFLYQNIEETSVDELFLENGRIFERYSAPMIDSDGKYFGRVWYFSDITERKKDENTLKISEEKYRTLLNTSPDSILLTDLKGIITEVSEMGLELFGTDNKDDLIGKDIKQFVFSEVEIIKKIFEKTINEGLVQNIELKLKKKNQSFFLVEASATLIQNSKGDPLSFMIIIRDISHRKKIETQQIHADRMASLGEMASGMAHEINQPLNIISMVMDKLLFESSRTESLDFEFFKGKSDKIFENILRIRNIIDHVKAFSRSNNDYVLTVFDVNTSIENAVSFIIEQFKHLGIILILQLERELNQIFGNTYKFEQVIINLLLNAKDAVLERKNKEEDYSEMIVKIISYQENQYLIVEITDNGIGIGDDDLQNIFLPFYTTKEEGKGTGIGLSICYQIIKEMNGTINISSDKTNGTIIKLVLDVHKEK